MSGARVRVFENGQLLTEEPASANGAGEVNVKIRSSTSTLYVEWAPATLPEDENLPYRRRYNVRLGDDGGLATDRRLWNLGFGQRRRREDNIRDYQRAYSQQETGNLRDVQIEVQTRHDDGEVPPFPPQAPPAGTPQTAHGGNAFMPAMFRPGSPDAGSWMRPRSDSPVQEQAVSRPAAGGGAQNAQGSLIATAGHLWLIIGLEPARGPLNPADLTVRLSKLPEPGKASYEHGPLQKPMAPGITHVNGNEHFVSFGFINLPLGTYTAMVHIANATGSRNGYALGSVRVEIKMGLLSIAYIGAKNEWPIFTAADPLLDLDVDVMQRRRKILATIAHYFPQSVDLRAKQKGLRPPYDQGEYGPMYISAAGQNNCAPFNVFIMGKATGKQAISKPDGSSAPIWGFGMDVNPGFVKWTDGVAPSVGDTYYLDDGAGFKHHCGIIVGSSAIVGQVWMVADGGQPDRTTEFKNVDQGWRRYYNRPYTNPDASEAAYVLPRLYSKPTGPKLGNLFIWPGETPPSSEFLPGWVDITHPKVPFPHAAYDAEGSEAEWKKARKLVLEVRAKVDEDRRACSAIERAAKAQGSSP